MTRTKLLLAALALSAASIPAQPVQVVLPQPPPPFWSKNNFPVAGPPMRYQQWFTAPQWVRTVAHPVRITGLDLVASQTGLGQAGGLLDIEVTMGNGPAFISLDMDGNLTNPFLVDPLPPVVVVPRSQHMLAAAVPGTFPLNLTFINQFMWDGVSTVVIDIKMWSNGVSTQPRSYDLEYTQVGGFEMGRMWGLSPDPNSVSQASFFQQQNGVAMRFTYEEGVTFSYGGGCPGAGNVVPEATTSGGLPLPGNALFTQVVNKANSQKSAVLLLGVSNTAFGAVPLPFDMSLLGGLGCELWTDIVLTVPATTFGGGPGAGSASIGTPIPPVTGFAGLSMFTQWLIWDAQAPNGAMAMSEGLQHIFG